MHPINRLLRPLGMKLIRFDRSKMSSGQRARLLRDLVSRFGSEIDIVDSATPLHVDEPLTEYVVTPQRLRVFRWLGFVTEAIRRAAPNTLLDVGSDVMWVTGIAAATDVTMVDIRDHRGRERFPFHFQQRNVLNLSQLSERFDMVTFPQVLHHVGLTYGQALDLDAPPKAFREIYEVLHPGGLAVFVTYVKKGRGMLPLGRGRIFGLNELKEFVGQTGFDIVSMRFADGDTFDWITESDVTDDPPIAERGKPHHYSDQTFVVAQKSK